MSSRQTFLALSGAALTCAAGRVAAQTLTPVRIGMAPTDGITPILYGIKTGTFRDAGFDVQFVVGNNGAAQMAALLGGSLDIAAAAVMPVLNAHVKGVPLRVIAGSTIFNPAAPSAGACVLKPSRFRSFADLAGATVMTSTLHSLSEVAVRACVDRSVAATLRFIEMPYSAMAAALEQGSADVGVLSEPSLSVAIAGGNLRSLGDPDVGIGPKGFLQAVFCSTASFVERSRDIIARFTHSLYDVTAYTNAHHAETVVLIAAYLHMEPEVVRKTTRQTLATSLDVGMMQPAIDAAAKYGYLDHGFDAKELLA